MQDIAQIVVRHIDVEILDRLEQAAVVIPLENHFGTRNHHFVAFAAHLLDEDGDLHFAARIDFESAGRFRVVHLQGNIAARLADRAVRARGAR